MIYIKKLAFQVVTAMTLFGCNASGTDRAEAAQAPVRPGTTEALAAVRTAAIPLAQTAQDYDALLRSTQGATRILLGESTHGTHEFYRERARITQRLIRDAGVNAIAIEGDWSPTYRVNLYVRGLGNDRTARQALRGYTNFPSWMWPNAEFAEFIEQLRTHNLALPANQRVGLYGMDVYDLFEAADAVVETLGQLDPAAAQRVKAHYRC
ncbi:MAG TPA: erythromycin esterase family protein, partial [Sphingomicrobium sp.]